MSLILAFWPFRRRYEASRGGPVPATRGSGPDRREWWVQDRASELQIPPTPAPWQGLPGPASLYLHLSSSSRLGRWVPGIAPLPPTRYTPPWYPPSPVHHLPCTKLTVQYTVPNTRFWDTVGEPRGMGTQPALWVPGRLFSLRLVYTAV